jgi:hypothetical protein
LVCSITGLREREREREREKAVSPVECWQKGIILSNDEQRLKWKRIQWEQVQMVDSVGAIAREPRRQPSEREEGSENVFGEGQRRTRSNEGRTCEVERRKTRISNKNVNERKR